MRKHTILLFLACALWSGCAWGYDDGQIKRKSLSLPSAESENSSGALPSNGASIFDEDKIATMQKQIHTLLERVEMLEHNISELKKQIINQEASAIKSSQVAHSSVPSATIDSDGTKPSNKSDFTDSNNAAGSFDKEKEDYDSALIALKNNDYIVAEEKFEQFITNYPKSSKLSNAYFWYGETFFRRNNFEKAAVNYLKGYKQFPKGEKAADSLLKLSLSLGSMKKTKEACIMLDKLDSEFKNRATASIKRSKEAKNKYGCR